jgi:predicted unusual protein kinase regulating ubiquinone biosynthesis (AarF/ABC1/UbiB family)
MLHHLFRQYSHSHTHNKKREYDFGPSGTPPIGEGGYSQVLKATWKTRGGMCVAVKVVRKDAIKEHSEYLKIIST